MKDKIVLIGMPGCGKTTIGKILANDLSYNFYDMDDYIEKMTNKSVADLFSISEDYFRDKETEACKELINKRKAIISSGGGVVKKKVNIDILKRDCIIVFIDRDVEDILNDLDSDSRPLLKGNKERIYNLYKERYELYKKSADIIIKNNKTIKDIVNEIIKQTSSLVKEK